MDMITIALIGLPIVIWLWLVFIGTIAAKFDSTLTPFQKKAQIIIVWLVPYLGASLIIFLVNQHSQEAIPRKLIPWPFKRLIFGKLRNKNNNRDDNEGSGIDLAISSSQHSHSDIGGTGGGSD